MAPAASALNADRTNLTLYGLTINGTGKLDIKTNGVDLFDVAILNLQTAINSGERSSVPRLMPITASAI